MLGGGDCSLNAPIWGYVPLLAISLSAKFKASHSEKKRQHNFVLLFFWLLPIIAQFLQLIQDMQMRGFAVEYIRTHTGF